MQKVIEKYKKLKSKIENNKLKMERLLKNDKVREYQKLLETNQTLEQEIEQTLIDGELKRYRECEHIFLKTGGSFYNDYKVSHLCPVYTCIKCGLSNIHSFINRETKLDLVKSSMYDVYQETSEEYMFIDDEEISLEELQKQYEEVLTISKMQGIKRTNREIVECLKLYCKNKKGFGLKIKK